MGKQIDLTVEKLTLRERRKLPMAGPLDASPKDSREILERTGPALARGEGGALDAFTCRGQRKEGSGTASGNVREGCKAEVYSRDESVKVFWKTRTFNWPWVKLVEAWRTSRRACSAWSLEGHLGEKSPRPVPGILHCMEERSKVTPVHRGQGDKMWCR